MRNTLNLIICAALTGSMAAAQQPSGDVDDILSELMNYSEETPATEEKTTIYAWTLMSNHAHILLRSGPYGVSKFMRQFLTGYAIYYNHRHKRHGHSSRGGSSTVKRSE